MLLRAEQVVETCSASIQPRLTVWRIRSQVVHMYMPESMALRTTATEAMTSALIQDGCPACVPPLTLAMCETSCERVCAGAKQITGCFRSGLMIDIKNIRGIEHNEVLSSPTAGGPACGQPCLAPRWDQAVAIHTRQSRDGTHIHVNERKFISL